MITTGHRFRRSGITLTEILIAILIMGIGLISLATLFPLGLLRLREGTRQGRSGITFLTAANDFNTRALLYKPFFSKTWYGARDPFTQDADSSGNYNQANSGAKGDGILAAGSLLQPNNNTDYANPLPDGTKSPFDDTYIVNPLKSGLPICYDPLWRDLTGVMPYVGVFDPTLSYNGALPVRADEARFGSGVFAKKTPYIPPDGGGLTSAYGIQRITNFMPWDNNINYATINYPFTCNNLHLTADQQPPDVAANIFTSVDDLVFNPPGGEVKVVDSAGISSSASPLLPDMTTGGPQADYRFSWFFTGRQVDANGNGVQFTGEIVVCDSRPFGFDPLPGSTASAPVGETVVEAVYGVGKGNSITRFPTNASSVGFAVNDRTVLLRWTNDLADPQVKVGSWICDVTYELYTSTYRARVSNTGTPFARCNWYQIGKRTDPQAELNDDGTPTGNRTMVVTLTTPIRTRTLLNFTTGTPVHRNVALIMPSVINVFARTFEVH